MLEYTQVLQGKYHYHQDGRLGLARPCPYWAPRTSKWTSNYERFVAVLMTRRTSGRGQWRRRGPGWAGTISDTDHTEHQQQLQQQPSGEALVGQYEYIPTRKVPTRIAGWHVRVMSSWIIDGGGPSSQVSGHTKDKRLAHAQHHSIPAAGRKRPMDCATLALPRGSPA